MAELLKKLTYPTLKGNLTQPEAEKVYQRNINRLYALICTIIFWTGVLLFANAIPLSIKLLNFGISILLAMCNLAVCRTRPELFEVFYAWILSIHPMVCGMFEEGLFLSLASVFLDPILVLVRCENELYSLYCLGINLAFYAIKLKPDIGNLMKKESVENIATIWFPKLHTYSALMLLVIFMYLFLSKRVPEIKSYLQARG